VARDYLRPVHAAHSARGAQSAVRAYPPRMGEDSALPLVVAGLALLIAGGLVWLVRSTLGRTLPIRVTGGLVVAGAALVATGVLAWAVAA
jgi:hypothetical protein